MQTTRFLVFGNCLGLHLVHLDDESPTVGLSMGVMLWSWLEVLGIAVAMREDEMGMWMWSTDPRSRLLNWHDHGKHFARFNKRCRSFGAGRLLY